jgi:predicted AlkP superfamily pyrophosphatase or phosphodiesterase
MNHMEETFIKPRYDSGGFACLPQRVTNLLTGEDKYDAVVLFLIDGFGWRFFERFQDTPFLKRAARLGQVEKITAQFPSTTAAQLTTLHTGLTVGEHGIFEWIYYEPNLDAVIAPLLFSFGGTSQRDTLKASGAKAKRLLPNTTLYEALKNKGVTSILFQHREYTPSTYGEVIFAGARSLGYKSLSEALVNLAEMLVKTTPSFAGNGKPTPAYYVVYNEKVDAISHEYGPEAPQTEAEILVVLMTMESIFQKALSGNRKKILFLLTADHGQSETNPLTTIYLNREKRFEGIEKFLRKTRRGELIVPAGSARDFFLYIQPGLVEEANAFLTARLEGRAQVRKVADLISEGYFGPDPSPKFRARAGDLVILPYRYESVWWYEKNKYEQKYKGHHGGLTPQEMEIPLLSWEM